MKRTKKLKQSKWSQIWPFIGFFSIIVIIALIIWVITHLDPFPEGCVVRLNNQATTSPIFKLKSSTRTSNIVVKQDQNTCQYSIEIGENISLPVSQDFINDLMQKLKNKPQGEPQVVDFPVKVLPLNNQYIILDVVLKDSAVLNKALETARKKLQPGRTLNIVFFGGSDVKRYITDILEIEWLSPQLEVSYKFYDRLNVSEDKYIVDLKSVKTSSQITDNLVKTNDLEYVDKVITEYYQKYKNNPNFNSRKYLAEYFSYLDIKRANKSNYILISDGEFEIIKSKQQNFNFTKESYYEYKNIYNKELSRYLKDVKTKNMAIKNALTDEDRKKAESIFVKSVSLNKDFNKYFLNIFSKEIKAKNFCLIMVDDGSDIADKEWFDLKNNLYNNLNFNCPSDDLGK